MFARKSKRRQINRRRQLQAQRKPLQPDVVNKAYQTNFWQLAHALANHQIRAGSSSTLERSQPRFASLRT